jgi:capsular polysaccharide transport system permease protein
MTTKLNVSRYRTRPPVAREPLPAPVPNRASAAKSLAKSGAPDPDMLFAPDSNDDGFGDEPFATARKSGGAGESLAAGTELDAIRREGLTGRQLRMARRLAQKHGLPATSDFDAIRLLRKAGIDPLQKSSVMDLVAGDEEDDTPDATSAAAPARSRALAVTPGDGVQLPQTIKPVQVPSTEVRIEQQHIAEVVKMQQDIAKRRRRRLSLLLARMAVFVFLPTFLAGWYYFVIATPMYAAKTEFQIQTANPAASAGLGGLLSNSPLGGSKDSIAVQGFLQSQEAMERLDADVDFRAHFSAAGIDTLQRLPEGASNSKVYTLYKKHVRISYDPTEGIVKMEVATADPDVSVAYSKALLSYAEEQVDQMTDRLREDQMAGALESFADAETKMMDAQQKVVDLQEKFKILSSEVEVGLVTTQIGLLEGQLTQDKLSLAQMESNENPNTARMDPVKRRIATLESEIAELRGKLTQDSSTGLSLAKVQSELLVGQANVATRQLMLAQSLQAMETARIEANRQTRYLTISVNPVPPDDPAYPKAFEDTLVVLMIFLGLYLMISMTVAILREQVTA